MNRQQRRQIGQRPFGAGRKILAVPTLQGGQRVEAPGLGGGQGHEAGMGHKPGGIGREGQADRPWG